MEQVSTKWVRVWLNNRDKKNIRAFSHVQSLTFGFADITSSEYVCFGVRAVKGDQSLYKLYQRTIKLTTQGGMLQGWIRAISEMG
jgi:hypothetical protein